MNALYEVLSRKEVQEYFQQFQRCWNCFDTTSRRNIFSQCDLRKLRNPKFQIVNNHSKQIVRI